MKKPDMPVPHHESNVFSWNGRHGVAEASDTFGDVDGRVWSDACDVGFYVRSLRTGERVLFLRTENVVCDGEVVAWEYRAHDRDVRITIYND